MASAKRMMGFLLMLALFEASIGAVVHKVGDSIGWTSKGNIDYTNWASTQTFHVGDTLLFEYNSRFHNVMEVTKNDFRLCSGSSAMASYSSGSDSITLNSPGHFYFICGVPEHCQVGQKVDVVVTPSTVGRNSSTSEFGPAHSSAQSTKVSLALSLVIIAVFGFAF